MLEGELVLVEDDGETVLQAGDCRRASRPDVANGHHLVNRIEPRRACFSRSARARRASARTIRTSICCTSVDENDDPQSCTQDRRRPI